MCDCIERINRNLSELGATRLHVPIRVVWEHKTADGSVVPTTFHADRVGVATDFDSKLKKRGEKAIEVVASFCPFCGEKYTGGSR